MRYILILFVIFLGLYVSVKHYDIEDPYSIGSHWDYTISCEGGFVYKHMSHKGTILLLNSDGTPLRCDEKRY